MIALAFSSTGCQRKMSEQGRIKPMQYYAWFSDKSSARMPVPDTVAQSNVSDNSLLFTGRESDGNFSRRYPVPVDAPMLNRGGERYGIYCAVCHGADGTGNGIVVQRGFTQPPSYRSSQLQAAAPGYIFHVMTQGFGVMDTYRDLVNEQDRWAIAAYIKTRLQLEGRQ
jgi:mono/diheme cytochrome c family protein